MATQQTARTLFVENNGVRYGHRRFGKESGVPLLFLQHFRATIDWWDPAVINPLALTRPVILFDNAGVGHSSGTVPDSFLGMAKHVIAFLSVLRIIEVDILGFLLVA